MTLFDTLQKPTLLLNESAARRNIHRMAEKARDQNVRFRPHFKTHQSIEIGEWFRPEGVTAITCSSLEMAEYFAAAGWDDITVAFPVNIREMDTINRLSGTIRLGLLVESSEALEVLQARLARPVDIWIKIDAGGHRTGLRWDEPEPVVALAKQAATSRNTRCRGLLTHAGNTYQFQGAESITPVYQEAVTRMSAARQALREAGLAACEVSVGDTPGCTLSPELGMVDEIRPGNFVFYDAHQLQQGVCRPEEVAVTLAVPVVHKHEDRREVIVYGGAIHLSKDFNQVGDRRDYGLPALVEGECWGEPISGAYVRSLSQEHGLVTIPGPEFDALKIGDLLCIYPAHSCLTVQVMRQYVTLDGRVIETLNK